MHLVCVFTTIHYCLITIHNVLKIIRQGGLEKIENGNPATFHPEGIDTFCFALFPKGRADVQVLG